MPMKTIYQTQTGQQDTGRLQVNVVENIGGGPIQNASVFLSNTGQPDSVLENLSTDGSGQTETIDLPSPPVEYSMQPSEIQPYSQYTVQISAEGYQPLSVVGIQILPGVEAILRIRLQPEELPQEASDDIIIPENTLFGNFPPKIEEAEIKPIRETGEIVLSRVVIPEYVIVHDGEPEDYNAPNYYVRYKDYIKNVASSEIYATWPDAAIRANILAIMSFTLNRVYTEWYRNKGYNFTVTSSTAYDQKWSYGRNIFSNISLIVDEMFPNYLSRPGVRQPILTQYCDGQRVSCPNWMTQWGSKYLGDQGYSAIEILRYYYGSDLYINTADQISGIPASWPGVELSLGSSGMKVRQIQEQLTRIARAYPALRRITADGVYGPQTQAAVEKFQQVFGLPVTGTIDFRTWYKISEIYVGVTRLAELA